MPALVLLCLLFGCTSDKSDSDDNPGYKDYVNQGKHYLMEGKGELAAMAFSDALRIQADSTEAKFGHILATTLLLPNMVDQIIDTIGAITFEDTGGEDNKSSSAYTVPPSQDSDQPIHDYLDEKLMDFIQASESYYTQLAMGSDFSFWLDRYVLTMADIDLISFSGEFDKTDLHFFGAIHALEASVVRLLIAHDLKFDYTKLVLPDLGESPSSEETLNAVLDIIEGLLRSEDFPTFLYLEPHYGVAMMQQSGIDLGNAFTRLGSAFQSLRFETGSQHDDTFRFVDLDLDGRYLPSTEPVMIGSDLLIQPALAQALEAMAEELAQVFYEGSTQDPDPNETTLLSLAVLNELLEALGILPFELGSLTIEEFPGLFGLNVGGFFADPAPDGLRNILLFFIDLLRPPETTFAL